MMEQRNDSNFGFFFCFFFVFLVRNRCQERVCVKITLLCVKVYVCTVKKEVEDEKVTPFAIYSMKRRRRESVIISIFGGASNNYDGSENPKRGDGIFVQTKNSSIVCTYVGCLPSVGESALPSCK